MLAPEEVFAPTSSDLRARSELTPVEKRSQRNQVRKAKRKERDALGSAAARASGKTLGSVKKQKEEAMKSVVKTGKGVTVIGKETKGPGRKARA
jgi:U3 small nucleolar RNA-associated protein MPP10